MNLQNNFNEAIIKLTDGTIIKGACESWTSADYGIVYIRISGTTYRVHASNATLIEEVTK